MFVLIWCQRNLTDDQRLRRKQVLVEILGKMKADLRCLGNAITGDETCIFQYDAETKGRLSVYESKFSQTEKEKPDHPEFVTKDKVLSGTAH
jgi:hypothetical protein